MTAASQSHINHECSPFRWAISCKHEIAHLLVDCKSLKILTRMTPTVILTHMGLSEIGQNMMPNILMEYMDHFHSSSTLKAQWFEVSHLFFPLFHPFRRQTHMNLAVQTDQATAWGHMGSRYPQFSSMFMSDFPWKTYTYIYIYQTLFAI